MSEREFISSSQKIIYNYNDIWLEDFTPRHIAKQNEIIQKELMKEISKWT